jgi:hypothetical protein
MKKVIILFYLLFGLILLSMSIAIGNNYELQTTFTTNPVIVHPGTNGYIELNLKNVGSDTVTNIEIKVVSRDSSVIKATGNWEVAVGDLGAGDSTSVFYEFYVPSSAEPDFYQVVFKINSLAGTSKQTAIVKVEDSTVLDIISIKPSSINIGEATNLVFNITNNGGISAGNILFIWDDPNDLILPVGSDNRIIISSIPAGNFTEIPIDVAANPASTPGVYPLTITMEFYDKTGTKQTITSEIGLQIGGTTDFEIVLQQSTSSTTSFAIANTGVNVASSVIVSIPQQTNYVASGTSSVSLGNLDAGDYTLASFTLSSVSVDQNITQRPSFDSPDEEIPNDFGNREDFINRSFRGFRESNNLIIEISYTDLFGVRQTVEKEVAISSIASASTVDFSSRFSGRTGFSSQSEESSNGTMYIIIGVVGIILIIAVLKIGKIKKLIKVNKKGHNK